MIIFMVDCSVSINRLVVSELPKAQDDVLKLKHIQFKAIDEFRNQTNIHLGS